MQLTRIGLWLTILCAVYSFLHVAPNLGPNSWIVGSNASAVLFMSVGLTLSILGLIGTRRRRNSKNLLALIAMYAVFLGGIQWVRDRPTGRFKQAYAAIQVGMTREDVEGLINHAFSTNGPSTVFGDNCGIVILESSDTRYDPRSFYVTFTNGRVTSKQYLPD